MRPICDDGITTPPIEDDLWQKLGGQFE